MAIDVKSSETVNQAANQAQEQQKSDSAVNFERLRKKTEALEQELQKSREEGAQSRQLLADLQSRFNPVRDEFDALPDDELLDKAKFKRQIEKERSQMRKEAEEIARQTYQKIDNENFATRLKTSYPDYDQVVNSENAEKLQEKDPEFVSLLAEVKDEYKRREMAYRRMKKLEVEDKPKVKAQDVVNENKQAAGSYYTPAGQGPSANPYAFEFDVRNREARTKAYERLKSAQKRAF